MKSPIASVRRYCKNKNCEFIGVYGCQIYLLTLGLFTLSLVRTNKLWGEMVSARTNKNKQQGKRTVKIVNLKWTYFLNSALRLIYFINSYFQLKEKPTSDQHSTKNCQDIVLIWFLLNFSLKLGTICWSVPGILKNITDTQIHLRNSLEFPRFFHQFDL